MWVSVSLFLHWIEQTCCVWFFGWCRRTWDIDLLPSGSAEQFWTLVWNFVVLYGSQAWYMLLLLGAWHFWSYWYTGYVIVVRAEEKFMWCMQCKEYVEGRRLSTNVPGLFLPQNFLNNQTFLNQGKANHQLQSYTDNRLSFQNFVAVWLLWSIKTG